MRCSCSGLRVENYILLCVGERCACVSAYMSVKWRSARVGGVTEKITRKKWVSVAFRACIWTHPSRTTIPDYFLVRTLYKYYPIFCSPYTIIIFVITVMYSSFLFLYVPPPFTFLISFLGAY